MSLCEEGMMSIFEMGTNFSQSEEHRSLIVKVGAAAAESVPMARASCPTATCNFGILHLGVMDRALKTLTCGYSSSGIWSSEISSKAKLWLIQCREKQE